MAYTTKDFYSTLYDTVPEESVERYLERASDYVDFITYDRLADGLPDDERSQTKIAKAVCEVADALYQIDEIRKSAMATVGTITKADGTVINKAVSSVSSGSESISYATSSGGTSSVYATAALDKKVELALIYQVAAAYLAGAKNNRGEHLLYAGLHAKHSGDTI